VGLSMALRWTSKCYLLLSLSAVAGQEINIKEVVGSWYSRAARLERTRGVRAEVPRARQARHDRTTWV
jgi:hypothetical protein